MKTEKIFIYWVIGLLMAAFIALSGLSIFSGYLFDLFMCSNTVKNATTSPSGKYRAVVFVRSCGTDGGSSTNISILKGMNELGNSAKGNIYRSVTIHPETTSILLWKSDEQLTINLPRCSRYGYMTKDTWGWFNEVSITYSKGNC